jgi:hypothetical protein
VEPGQDGGCRSRICAFELQSRVHGVAYWLQ